MPAPKKYRQTTPFFFNPEADRFNKFKEICHKEKKSIQEKLNEVIVKTIEEHGIGKDNPLGISYGPPVQQKLSTFIKNPLEALDGFIDSGTVGMKDWQPVFAEVQDQEKMDKYVNLTNVMHTAAKNRQSYLKTGKIVVSIGKIQTLPTMKGTRSGF